MDTVPRPTYPTHPDEIDAMLRERAALDAAERAEDDGGIDPDTYWCPVCNRCCAVYMRQAGSWHPDRIECFRCGQFWMPYTAWVTANAEALGIGEASE